MLGYSRLFWGSFYATCELEPNLKRNNERCDAEIGAASCRRKTPWLAPNEKSSFTALSNWVTGLLPQTSSQDLEMGSIHWTGRLIGLYNQAFATSCISLNICITRTHNIDTKTAWVLLRAWPFYLTPLKFKADSIPLRQQSLQSHAQTWQWIILVIKTTSLCNNNRNEVKKKSGNQSKTWLDKSWIMDSWRLTCRLQHLQQATVATKLWERIWRGLEMEHESIMMSLPTYQWFEWWVEKVNMKNNFPLPQWCHCIYWCQSTGECQPK